MRKGKGLVTLLFMLGLFIIFPSPRVYAEARNIYVGDLVNLKLTSQSITEDEIREKFADFEIVALKEKSDGYLLTIRSFEPGEKTIQLGNEKLKITVKSTLDDINRKDVFPGALGTKQADLSFAGLSILIPVVFVFLVTGTITGIKLLRKKKLAALTPYERFKNRLEHISLTEASCFVKLTQSLKEYMEASLSLSIRGKTSSEILKELSLVPGMENLRKELESWFLKCDYYKFTRSTASLEQKQSLLEGIKALVINMEREKEA